MGLIKLLKNYKELGHDEFFKRWKAGIKAASPVQQLNGQLIFTRITLVGILLGLAVSIYYWKASWWLAIILFGALGNSYFQYAAIRNQRNRIRDIEKSFELNTKEEVKNV